MKPFLEPIHLEQGQEICQRLVKSMQQLDPKSCIVGLAMACVFASDATDTALESVFQMMRDMRKNFVAMQTELNDARARGEVPAEGSSLIVPDDGPKIIVP